MRENKSARTFSAARHASDRTASIPASTLRRLDPSGAFRPAGEKKLPPRGAPSFRGCPRKEAACKPTLTRQFEPPNNPRRLPSASLVRGAEHLLRPKPPSATPRESFPPAIGKARRYLPSSRRVGAREGANICRFLDARLTSPPLAHARYGPANTSHGVPHALEVGLNTPKGTRIRRAHSRTGDNWLQSAFFGRFFSATT